MVGFLKELCKISLAMLAWERLKAGGEGDNRGQDGCCSQWGHKESDTTELLNNWHEIQGKDHEL